MDNLVCVIDTRVANTASVIAALKRVGLNPFLSSDKDDVLNSSYAVLPGVGSFDAGIKRLDDLGLIEAITQRIKANKPTLCICLGMQMLASSSEEGRLSGLNVFDVKITKFSKSIRTPQFGWNMIEAPSSSNYLQSGYAYFANSYCLKETPENSTVATSNYGENFIAAFEKGSLLACQFHPELSGELGMNILQRWAKQSGATQ